jgi:hypothetical protein
MMINILAPLIFFGLVIPKLKDFLILYEQNIPLAFLIGSLIFCLVGWIVIKYLIPWSFWAVEKIFKGFATVDQIRLVVVYSLSPFLIYLAIGLILIAAAIINKNIDLIYYQHPFTYFVVWVFSTRSMVYGLSYFNKFSYGYGLLTFILPSVFIELMRQLIIN